MWNEFPSRGSGGRCGSRNDKLTGTARKEPEPNQIRPMGRVRLSVLFGNLTSVREVLKKGHDIAAKFVNTITAFLHNRRGTTKTRDSTRRGNQTALTNAKAPT